MHKIKKFTYLFILVSTTIGAQTYYNTEIGSSKKWNNSININHWSNVDFQDIKRSIALFIPSDNVTPIEQRRVCGAVLINTVLQNKRKLLVTTSECLTNKEFDENKLHKGFLSFDFELPNGNNNSVGDKNDNKNISRVYEVQYKIVTKQEDSGNVLIEVIETEDLNVFHNTYAAGWELNLNAFKLDTESNLQYFTINNVRGDHKKIYKNPKEPQLMPFTELDPKNNIFKNLTYDSASVDNDFFSANEFVFNIATTDDLSNIDGAENNSYPYSQSHWDNELRSLGSNIRLTDINLEAKRNLTASKGSGLFNKDFNLKSIVQFDNVFSHISNSWYALSNPDNYENNFFQKHIDNQFSFITLNPQD